MKDKKVIACTGGIGSGKSYVIKAFNVVGIPSYNSDKHAKSLYDNNSRLLRQVASIVGKDIMDKNGVNRRLLADRIFGDTALLEKVEAVVHPAVIADFEKWKDSQNCDTVIFESAIFLQKPALRSIADSVVVVSAPKKVRIKRVMKRDGMSRAQVEERMRNQLSFRQMKKDANYVIYTNDKKAVLPQIDIILKNVAGNGIR